MLDLPVDRRWLIGVVHLPPTPGAPRWRGSLASLVETAVADAAALAEGGADALVVENFGDAPFFAGAVPPETVAALALCTRALIGAADGLPVGVNVLRNDVRAALGICAATGARFVRVNVHTGAAVTDQGLIEGRAAETLRERARLCPDVAILADVHVKHATPLGGGSIETAARDLVGRGLADGVIVSGTGTGSAPDAELVRRVRPCVGEAALLLGSGVTAANAGELCAAAHGAIVGTSLKRGARVDEPVEVERVRALRRVLDALGDPRRERA
jgi:membrane complex biogenesis BtpA family protein